MPEQGTQDLRRPDPLTAFRFLIRVGDSQQISAAFSRFSGVRMEVETIQTRDGDDNRGVKEYTPVFTSYAPVTLSKGVVGDNEFLDWLLSAGASAAADWPGEPAQPVSSSAVSARIRHRLPMARPPFGLD